jgi:hypothetical protein
MARNGKADVSGPCQNEPSVLAIIGPSAEAADREVTADCRRCPSGVSRWLLVIESQGKYGSPTSSCLLVLLCRTATHSSCRGPKVDRQRGQSAQAGEGVGIVDRRLTTAQWQEHQRTEIDLDQSAQNERRRDFTEKHTAGCCEGRSLAVVIKTVGQALSRPCSHPWLELEQLLRVIDPDGRNALLQGKVPGFIENPRDGERRMLTAPTSHHLIAEQVKSADARLLGGGVGRL